MKGEFFPNALPTQAPPETGSGAAAVRLQRIPLDNARDDVEINIKGNFLWAIAASDISAITSIKFNDQSGTAFPFRRGSAIGGLPFNRLYVTNSAQAGKYIDVLTVIETPIGPFRIQNPDIAFNEVTLTLASTNEFGTYAQIVPTAIELAVAALPNRRRLLVKASVNNTTAVRVGDAGLTLAGTGPGWGLDPGDELVLETQDELYMTASVAGQRIYFVEEY